MNHTLFYFAGVIVGALAMACVILLVRRCTRHKGFCRGEYDERQLAARGRAYQAGFFTVLIWEMLFACVDAAGIWPCADYVGIFLGAFLGIAVFAVSAILQDAYLSLNAECKSFVLLGAVVTAINACVCVIGAIDGRWGEDDTLWLNLMCAVLFGAILLTLLAHHRRQRREEMDE